MDFWKELKFPIFALAPMEEVTDTVFRELVLSVSEPENLHILFTEFTSVDGMLHSEGRKIVSQRLHISAGERKLLKEKHVRIIAQLWGSQPESFFRAARIVKEDYLFDGVDINMGCPVKKIVNQGACSALIQNPELAKEIIQAVKEGSGMPVSVKTRIGFNEIETESWITSLLSAQPSAIIIHGRTRKMQSEGKADWNEIAKAVNLRNQIMMDTKIIGNGDVVTLREGIEKTDNFKVDGVMIGRGIFHNPWFFSAFQGEKSKEEKLYLLLKHAELFNELWEGQKNFAVLRRFFKIYLTGFPGAVNMRTSLMKACNLDEVRNSLYTWS